MRVLIASPVYLDPGNRGKLAALAAEGIDLRVAVPKTLRHSSAPMLGAADWGLDHGVSIAPVRVSRSADPAEARWSGRELTRLALDFRPDIVHVESELDWPLAAVGSRTARRSGAKLTAFVAANVPRRSSWHRRRRRRSVGAQLSGVVGSSTAAMRLALDVAPRAQGTVMPQFGIEPPEPAPFRPDRFRIGFVGRLTRTRGLDVLLEALARLSVEHWTLAIAGDGPERERLDALTARLRLASRVEWHGALTEEQLGKFWRNLDVLVVPSRPHASWAEPVADIASRAMLLGLPVVGTDVGAIPDRIVQAGMVVPPEDPAALANGLLRLATSADERGTMGQACRSTALARFTNEAIARELVRWWRGLVATPETSPTA